VDIGNAPNAKDYGNNLERSGFRILGQGETLLEGDVVVIQPYVGVTLQVTWLFMTGITGIPISGREICGVVPGIVLHVLPTKFTGKINALFSIVMSMLTGCSTLRKRPKNVPTIFTSFT
jgi:hypothetical protein